MDGDSSHLLGQIIFLLVLVFVNAFFAMSEIAIVTLNDAKLRKMAEDGHKKAAMLVKLLRQPSRFLATIQVGVTLSGFLASAVAADTFAGYLVNALAGKVPLAPSAIRTVSIVVITLLLSYLTLVFGELVPKRIAMQRHEKIAFAVAGPLTAIAVIERPFVALLSSSTNGILRLLGISPDSVPETVTEEEIRMMVDVGNESGNIEESDKEMINNIFEFDDTTAEELMTHRTEVVAVEVDAPIEEIIDIAVESGYSRIPVIEDDLDSIIGVLYVKDLLERVTRGDQPFDVKKYMREPMYVLESISCKLLFTEFKAKKVQMAVVVDEYGGTAGIITMEDLLESIVGNIQDEYDDEEEEISQIGESLYLVDGQADLEEVADYFSIRLDEEDEDEFETIGGYIVHQLGFIPTESDHPSVRMGDVVFTVESVDERRIDTLRAEILPPEPLAEPGEK